MIQINSFSVIGGDKRQIALAESLMQDGYTVYAAGFEQVDFVHGVLKTGVKEAIEKSDILILPLPASTDGLALNAPFAAAPIFLDDEFIKQCQGKRVFCGMAQKLFKSNELWKSVSIFDYSTREEFSVKNAVPTAEGAIELAMKEYPGTINGARCLVAGYGRIGKVLASMLKGIGADVTVSARKPADMAWIELNGYHSLQTSKIIETNGYQLIFNTVPKLIFDAPTLAKSAEKSIVIDLASAPGGVDFKAASRLEIRALQALSLPGKVAPKAAGEIIKTTIYNMLEEELR